MRQYEAYGKGAQDNATAPTLFSSDAGQTWAFAGFTRLQGEHAYARDPATPGALHTISVGLAGVGPPPWTTLSTAGHAQTEFFVGQGRPGSPGVGRLLTRPAERVVTLRGIPDALAIDPALCATTGGFFPPVASTPLPDGSQLLTLTMCTRSHVNVTWCEVNPNPHCTPDNPTQCEVCAKRALSMASFRSTDGGWDWRFRGMVQQAKDYVPLRSTQGTTEEVDLTLLPDNRTVMW